MSLHSRKTFIKGCAAAAVSVSAGGLSSILGASGDEEERDERARFEPPYVRLQKSGELRRRGQRLWERMRECRLCPRECGARRLDGDKGFCGATSRLVVSSYHPHSGEERPLVGRRGSGTIFFTHCNMRCVFCINWQVSQGGQGAPETVQTLANMMLSLQRRGCHNINIVTPTHYSPHVLLALDRAATRGLRLPLVYNTSGFERADVLALLDGVVDIYLPDFKYADGAMADRYSAGAATYPSATKAALIEMQRQVGVARPERDGLMRRGLMIRHLVMPNGVSGSKQVFEWIGANLPKDTYVNVMSQYRPMYRAAQHPDLARRLTRQEFADAVRWAREAGLTNLDVQG